MDTTYDAHDPATTQPKLEELFQQSQPTLTPDDAPPPKPEKLSDIDQLKLENVSLKLMNVGQQLNNLNQQGQALVHDRMRLSRQFDELRKEYLERYGIDITLTHIDENGFFRGPIGPQMAGPSK